MEPIYLLKRKNISAVTNAQIANEELNKSV